MKIAIFGNSSKKYTPADVHHLIDVLKELGVEISLSNELRMELNLREYDEYAGNEDIAISAGGDGTFLTTAMSVANAGIPILGINCGHLGFLADIERREAERVLKQITRGKYTIEERPLLKVSTSGGGHIANNIALNEVAILKQGMSSMISVEVHMNQKWLNTYNADGLVIATPTGSTAYNMSAGGPLILPGTECVVLTPIAGHSLNVRPLVIPNDSTLELKTQSRNNKYMVSLDGRSQILSEDVTLRIEKADYKVRLVRVAKHDFIRSLKEKLGWT